MSTKEISAADPQPTAQPAPPTAGRSMPWFSPRDLGPAAAVLVVLAAVGALLGLWWQHISPRTKGFVYLPHAVIPDEKEAFVASDGRYLLMTGAVGIVVAVAAWLWRSTRGPAVGLALVVGGLLGALLTDFVGRLTGGGHDDGTVNAVITLPIRVHARGLLLIEPALAALVYSACALFAKRDDLGVDESGLTEAAALDAAPGLQHVAPEPGESLEWATRRIEVTLDRAVDGDARWLRAFVRGPDGYTELTVEPLESSVGPDGGVVYAFAVVDLPSERPAEVLVQLRRPHVDARSLPAGQWTFTVIEVADAP
jgi:hypothetical protein